MERPDPLQRIRSRPKHLEEYELFSVESDEENESQEYLAPSAKHKKPAKRPRADSVPELGFSTNTGKQSHTLKQQKKLSCGSRGKFAETSLKSHTTCRESALTIPIT